MFMKIQDYQNLSKYSLNVILWYFFRWWTNFRWVSNTSSQIQQVIFNTDIKTTVLKIKLKGLDETHFSEDEKLFNIVLAGHSHAGQVRLPFIGVLYTPKYARKYYEPYYKLDNTELYISNGLGTSEIPIRLFNRPSYNFYRLYKK